MQEITVKKSELLDKIRANRDTHRQTFEKAQEVYRAKMIEELDRMLDEAKRGEKIRRAFRLPEPEDHTSDYDQCIAMLEMHVGEEIDLSHHEFRQYVMDEWGWQASFTANTASYVVTPN